MSSNQLSFSRPRRFSSPTYTKNLKIPGPISLSSSHPGRTRKAAHDPHHRQSFGGSISTKDDFHTRVFFQNIKGLTSSSSCEDFKYCLDSLVSFKTDIVGLSETNVPWDQVPHLPADFRTCLRRQFHTGKAIFSSPNAIVDPVKSTDAFQAGGNLMFTIGALVPMLTTSSTVPLTDPTGMGRWCGMTVRGLNGNHLSVITAYRVCRGTVSSDNVGSSFNREFCYLRETGHKNPTPRTHFLTSLTTLIHDLQQQGHAIIIMLDANSTLVEDSSLQTFVETSDLHDLHASDPAPSTYLLAPERRLDYMFGCSKVRDTVKQSGSLSYYDGPQSDHRGLFVDLDLRTLLGYTPSPLTLLPSSARLLKAGNPELVAIYIETVNTYYANHDMRARIDRLHSEYHTMSRDAVRRRLEAWDDDQGRAMRAGENALKKPAGIYKWSPSLRNAGLIRQYWKLRLLDAELSTNHTVRISCIESQITQHDPSFVFPLRQESLSAEEIRPHLNQSSKSLRHIQRDSEGLRQTNLYAILAKYEAGGTSLSPNENPETDRDYPPDHHQ